MASKGQRRSRTYEADEDDTRSNTPLSTAPNDSKRRKRRVEPDESDDSPSDDLSAPVISLARPSQNAHPVSTGGVPQAGHKPGAIVRVKLTNFVTYTSAEFFPGPNLNMVIGPNGTGKSTLVCAICLGLGWPPSVSFGRYPP